MDQFFNVSEQLLQGFGENCIIFIVTLLAAIPLGLIISMGSMSKFKPLKWLTKTFVWIIRGTPLMLQLFVVFYVPPLVSNGSVTFARMNAALIAFIINYAAYFSEIFRGGIESVPKGQYEAGQVLAIISDPSLAGKYTTLYNDLTNIGSLMEKHFSDIDWNVYKKDSDEHKIIKENDIYKIK